MPSFLTVDVIVLIVLAIVIFFLSFSKPKILTKALLAIYIAVLIFTNVPYLNGQSAAILVGAFTGLFLLILFCLRKSLRVKIGDALGGKFLTSILLSVASIIVLLALYYHILPIDQLYTLTLPVEAWFTKVPLGIWYAVPIIIMFFIARDGD